MITIDSITPESIESIEATKSEKLSQPYLIVLKNLTDEELSDVDLFNYDYDKQSEIEYSTFPNIKYADILRKLASENKPEIIIDRILICVESNDHDSSMRQINTKFFIIYSDINGNMSKMPYNFTILSHDGQKTGQMLGEFNFYNKLQIQLRIVPQAVVTILLYPKDPEITSISCQ